MSQFSAQATASAQLAARGTRCMLRGFYVRGAATAGTAVFLTGGSGGTALCTINTPAISTAGALAGIYIPIPGEGIMFNDGIYCTLTTADAVTIFYDKVS